MICSICTALNSLSLEGTKEGGVKKCGWHAACVLKSLPMQRASRSHVMTYSFHGSQWGPAVSVHKSDWTSMRSIKWAMMVVLWGHRFCGEPIISLREKGAVFLQNDISVHTQNVWSVRAGLECRDHMISCIYGTHHTRKRLIHLIDVVSTSLSAVNRWDMKYLFGGISWHSGSFPGGPNGKESTCQYRRHKRHGIDPWVWNMPWKRKWQPTPVRLPGKFYGQRSLVGYSPWGPKESDKTEHTHTQHPKPYL